MLDVTLSGFRLRFQKLDFAVRGSALSQWIHHVDKSGPVLECIQVLHDRIILKFFQSIRRILILIWRELTNT